MIRIEHLEKKFPNGGTVLKDVNAVINDGDVVALIGPSGTGKSTLLRCINMLSGPTGGKIFIDDEEITAPDYPVANVHKKVSMVFQSYNLFEHVSVIENVMMPQVSVLKRDKQEAYDKGMALLKSVGMAQKKDSFPSALSGGQKQRVAIARTLAMDPTIILFDEPTSALDPASVDEVKTVIRRVAKSGVTAFIVTHDMELARSISSKIFYMDQGIIYEEGTPDEIFNHPKKERTRDFLQKARTLEAEVAGRDFDYPALMSQIYEFGQNNQIPPDVVRTMQMATEEMICSILLRLLEDPVRIMLQYQYTANTGDIRIKLSYGGKAFNPMSLGKPDLSAATANVTASDVTASDITASDGKEMSDEKIQAILAIKLLRNYLDDIVYVFEPQKDYPNVLKMYLKKK